MVDGKLSSGCCGLWLSHGIFWTGSHMLEIVYAGCAEAGRQEVLAKLSARATERRCEAA